MMNPFDDDTLVLKFGNDARLALQTDADLNPFAFPIDDAGPWMTSAAPPSASPTTENKRRVREEDAEEEEERSRMPTKSKSKTARESDLAVTLVSACTAAREEDAAFLADVFSCSICLDLLMSKRPRRILETGCCHNMFCEPCITSWLEHNATCPLCRESEGVRPLARKLEIEQQLSHVKTPCVNAKMGCGFVGERGEALDRHEEGCTGGKKSVSSPENKEWTCETCTLINGDARGDERCSACDAPNPSFGSSSLSRTALRNNDLSWNGGDKNKKKDVKVGCPHCSHRFSTTLPVPLEGGGVGASHPPETVKIACPACAGKMRVPCRVILVPPSINNDTPASHPLPTSGRIRARTLSSSSSALRASRNNRKNAWRTVDWRITSAGCLTLSDAHVVVVAAPPSAGASASPTTSAASPSSLKSMIARRISGTFFSGSMMTTPEGTLMYSAPQHESNNRREIVVLHAFQEVVECGGGGKDDEAQEEEQGTSEDLSRIRLVENPKSEISTFKILKNAKFSRDLKTVEVAEFEGDVVALSAIAEALRGCIEGKRRTIREFTSKPNYF